MILLERITDMASTLLAPTVCWVPADFFQLADWSGLSRLPYLPHYLEQAGWAKWRRIKSLPGGDWTALACQRFVGRTAYGAQTGNASPFHEDSPFWIAPAGRWGRWPFRASGFRLAQPLHRPVGLRPGRPW
jgi:predicted component of type VI protein secretion system